jgi:hypothetical protein
MIGPWKGVDGKVHADNGTLDRRRSCDAVARKRSVIAALAVALRRSGVRVHWRIHAPRVAIRGPVPVGSLADIVVVTTRPTTVSEVNGVFVEEAHADRYRAIVGVTDEAFVSSDIIKDSRASVIDLGMTRVVDGDLMKVLSWYDNEWGYSSQMVREAVRIAATLDRTPAERAPATAAR